MNNRIAFSSCRSVVVAASVHGGRESSRSSSPPRRCASPLSKPRNPSPCSAATISCDRARSFARRDARRAAGNLRNLLWAAGQPARHSRPRRRTGADVRRRRRRARCLRPVERSLRDDRSAAGGAQSRSCAGPRRCCMATAHPAASINVITNRVPEIASDRSDVRRARTARGQRALGARGVSARGWRHRHLGVARGCAQERNRRRAHSGLRAFAPSCASSCEDAGEHVNEIARTVSPTPAAKPTAARSAAPRSASAGFLGPRRQPLTTPTTAFRTRGGEDGVHIDMRQTRYDLKGELHDLGHFITSARVRRQLQRLRACGSRRQRRRRHAVRANRARTRASCSITRRSPAGAARSACSIATSTSTSPARKRFVPPLEHDATPASFLFEERPFGDLTLELGARLEHQHIHVDRGGRAAELRQRA